MTKITPQIIATVTQRYLHAKTLDEIVQETGLSKGTVYKITSDWRQLIGGTAIEEIKAFTSTVRKSGMTIQECALGFRIAQMLKGLNIRDELDDEKTQGQNNSHENKNLYTDALAADHFDINQNENENSRPTGKHILYFIEKIYFNCKKQDIQPHIIVDWINDLFDCYYSLENKYQINNTNEDSNKIQKKINYSFSSLSNGKESVKNIDNHFDLDRTLDSYDDKTFMATSENFQISKKVRKEIKELENEENKSSKEKEDKPAAEAAAFETSTTTTNIPLVSRISYYITELKEEIIDLKNFKKDIYQDIQEANDKEKALVSEIEDLTNKNKDVMIFFQWYSNLKQELQNKYNVIMEEEFEYFAKAVTDFKSYNYDINLLLKDYKEIYSLKQELSSFQDTINTYSRVKDKLLNEVSDLNDRVGSLKQTINTYNELYYAGFGLKELKQLVRTITEISLANNINMYEAVSEFLKDVEEQYDDKLGFEKKVNELKQEKERLAAEVPEYKNSLRLQSLVGPALIYLTNNGVTNQDIIGIYNLVSTFTNFDFLSDPTDQNINTNTATFNFSGLKISNSDPTLGRSEYWQLFISKLQNLKNINLEINKQASSLNNLKKQIRDLKYNKQQLDKSYIDTATNISNILTKISQAIDIIQHVNEITKMKRIPPNTVIFTVFMKSDPTDNKEEKK